MNFVAHSEMEPGQWQLPAVLPKSACGPAALDPSSWRRGARLLQGLCSFLSSPRPVKSFKSVLTLVAGRFCPLSLFSERSL